MKAGGIALFNDGKAAGKKYIVDPIVDTHTAAVDYTAGKMMDVDNAATSAKAATIQAGVDAKDATINHLGKMKAGGVALYNDGKAAGKNYIVDPVVDTHAAAVDYTADKMMDIDNAATKAKDATVENLSCSILSFICNSLSMYISLPGR